MAPVKLSSVISFSSEDSSFPSSNLLREKKWRSSRSGETNEWVLLQLEKASQVTAIDIGNDGSAFVEVLVGRTGMLDADFQVLLVMSSFMTPLDSRSNLNVSRVRMFPTEKLVKTVSDEKWDRVRIVCSQPFNKQTKYGLSFVKLHSPQQKQKPDTELKLGNFTLKGDPGESLEVGSLFSKRKEKTEHPPPLTGAVGMRVASSLAAAALATPQKRGLEDEVNLPRRDGTPGESVRETFDKTPKHKKQKHDNDHRTDKPKHSHSDTPTKPHTDSSKHSDKHSNKHHNGSKHDSSRNHGDHSKKHGDSSSRKHADDSRKNGDHSRKNGDHSRNHSDRSKDESRNHRPASSGSRGGLLKDVGFVLSGYVNPARGDIRAKAVDMGAKYYSEWGKHCTHLICAFKGTPKYKAVLGQGKIVNDKWILESYRDKCRHPWRRYRLDSGSKSDGSDEETVTTPKVVEEDEVDSADEIEKLQKEELAAAGADAAGDDVACDAAVGDDADDYGGDTDVDEEDETKPPTSHPLPQLPDVFNSQAFYIHTAVPRDMYKYLLRYITACNGVMVENSSRASYIVYDTWSKDLNQLKQGLQHVKLVDVEWVNKCISNLQMP